MLIFFSLFCVVVTLLLLYLNKDKDYWRKRNVVQVDGVIRSFLSRNQSLAELYKELYDRYSNEKYIGIFVGSRPALLLRDTDDISSVLQRDFHSFHSRGILTNTNDLLADNFFFMNDYRRWKLMRQKITPVFTQMKLKNMFYIIERCARDFVLFMEDNATLRSKSFDSLYTYTTASIAASVFGIDTQTKNTMDCPFMDMAWKAFKPTLAGNLKFALSNYCPSLFKFLRLTTFGEHESFFIDVMKRVLESRRKSKERRNDFIDTCLELQQSGILKDETTGYEIEPTDEILAAQAFFFFIAGADPSASTMHYTLIELANNPSILKRLHEEIDKVYAECKGTLAYEDIDKLVYLDMVINESMRKHPNIGSIQRTCMKSTVLSSGLKIEESTTVLIPIFALHRDEQYYTKPEVFDPERFAPDNVSNIVKFAYLPFGGGNRVCIGARFARLQIKIGLAALLHRYTLVEKHLVALSYEPSFFALRDTQATYELVLRVEC